MTLVTRWRRLVGGALALPLLAVLGCGGGGSRQAATGDGSDPALTPAGGGSAAAAANVRIPGVERANTALTGIRNLREQLTAARVQVDRTLAALSQVMKGQGDLVPALKNFTVAVADTKAAQQQVVARTEQMRAEARDYITGWEVEVYGVEDPDLRRQAEARRTQVRGNYARINETMKATRAAYGRFETALDDIKRFLDNDLTRAGIAAASASAARTNEAGAELKRQIDGSVAELDRVAGEMTPTGPAAGSPAATR